MSSADSRRKLAQALLEQGSSAPDRSSIRSPNPTSELPSQAEVENEVIRLYAKMAPVLTNYGMGICGDLALAEDAVQEAFLRYYVALRNATAHMDSKGWLHSTTRNYILDRMKEYEARNRKSLESALLVKDDSEAPDVAIMLSEIGATADGLLSPRERECLHLRNQGMRYRDIAGVMKIDTATVGVLLGRAIKKIRTALNRQAAGR